MYKTMHATGKVRASAGPAELSNVCEALRDRGVRGGWHGTGGASAGSWSKASTRLPRCCWIARTTCRRIPRFASTTCAGRTTDDQPLMATVPSRAHAAHARPRRVPRGVLAALMCQHLRAAPRYGRRP